MSKRITKDVPRGIPRDEVKSLNIPRRKVYEAIDSEIEFVESFVVPERKYYVTHTLGEFILMINQYAAQAQPSQLGQEDTRIGGVELDLLGVGVAKACPVAAALEARELRSFGEEILVGPLQVLESLLLRVHGRIGQPRGGRAVAPGPG